MIQQFCPSCRKIFTLKHKCLKQDRYQKIADGNRARAYKYQCLQCVDGFMTAKERLDHEEYHKNKEEGEQYISSSKSFQIWKFILLTQMATKDGENYFQLKNKTYLGTRFLDIANIELSIVRKDIIEKQIQQIAEITKNQIIFSDQLFELEQFSRKKFKNKEIESIIFFKWILNFIKPQKIRQIPKKKYYSAPKRRFRKRKEIKKEIMKRKTVYSVRSTALIRRQLVYNNIIDFLNVDYDLKGRTSFDQNIFKKNVFEKMIVFLDDLEYVEKTNEGYRIALRFFKARKNQIIQYLYSFEEEHIYEKLRVNNSIISTEIKELLNNDIIFNFLSKNITQNVTFFSEMVKDYTKKAKLFKIKFSDFELNHYEQRQKISKIAYNFRRKYDKAMKSVFPCGKEDYDILMDNFELQKNISTSLFRNLTKFKVIAERLEEVRAAVNIFIKSINEIRQKQMLVDVRINIQEYCEIKRKFRVNKILPENKRLMELFGNENCEQFEQNVQQMSKSFRLIYFRKTFSLCLQFVHQLAFFANLRRKPFSDWNWLQMEKYRIRSVHEKTKEQIYTILQKYFQSKKKIHLDRLWSLYNWQSQQMAHSYYVQCIEDSLNRPQKKEDFDLNMFSYLDIKEEKQEIIEEDYLLSKQKQHTFINRVVWKFINSAHSVNGVKYFNDYFDFYLINPSNGIPTATFFLKKHREHLVNIFSEKTENQNVLATFYLEEDLRIIEDQLFKEYLEAFLQDFGVDKFNQLLDVGNSTEISQRICFLFEQLVDQCLKKMEQNQKRSIYSEYSKKHEHNFKFKACDLKRIQKLKIGLKIQHDLDVFTYKVQNVAHSVQKLHFSFFQRFRNTKRLQPNKITKLLQKSSTKSISTHFYSVFQNEIQESHQTTVFQGQQLDQKIQNAIAKNNCYRMAKQEQKWIDLQPNLQKIVQKQDQISLECFQKFQFAEINKLPENLFEDQSQKELFLQFYSQLLNKVDLPFKIEAGKILRKYPDLWTLKQIYKIKHRKKEAKQFSCAQKAQYSKQQKGLFKFRKCAICMTRGRLSFCCKACLSLYHQKCFENLNLCVTCQGQLPMKEIVSIFISPGLFQLCKQSYNILDQEQIQNKINNINIIKMRGNHTYQNIFSQGFIFRNHFPRILYLSDDLQLKIEAYNKKYCFPFKIKTANEMGFGCFATEDIQKQVYLCEYCGDVVNPSKAKNMEYTYHLWPGYTGIDEYCVCPQQYWSEANFINHSNQPNCYAQTLMSYRGPRILIFASRKILKGEQLFYNYNGAFSLYAVNWDK